MLLQFQRAIVRLLTTVASPAPLMPRVLKLRFDHSRLETVDSLIEFIHTRSSYIAQTSLHGYLKARMGTSFRVWFEDEAFSASIRIASVKVFLSCLSDLTVYAVATASRQAVAGDAVLAALAGHAFRKAALAGLAGHPEREDLDAPIDAFHRRARDENWRAAGEGRAAFAGSEADLVRFAPVIDEYRELDHEIVANSIRFRWRDIREQIRRRMDGHGLLEDWNAGAGRGEVGC